MNRLTFIRRHLLAALVITASGLLLYGHSVQAPFYFDDIPNIVENRHLQITDLSFVALKHAAFKGPSANRPLAKISFALNYVWSGHHVAAYRFVNIGIHIVNAVMVYFLALIIFNLAVQYPKSRQIRNDPGLVPMALIVALIFLVHPVQIQSVTYIVQRMTALATLFYLAAFIFYLKGRGSARQGQQGRYYMLSMLAWILGLATKEITFTFPFLVLVAESCFFKDRNGNSALLTRAFMVGMVLVAGCVFLIYLGSDPLQRITAPYAYRDFTLGERSYTQLRVVLFYLSLLVFPIPTRFNLLHHFPISRSLFDPATTFLSLLVISSLIGFAIWRARKNPVVAFGIFWFFLHLVIESSIIGLEMVFEHRLYLPMVGFSLFVCAGLMIVFTNRHMGMWLTCSIIMIGLGTATYLRNDVWRDRVVFWEDVLAKNPHSHRAHIALGIVKESQGRVDEALKHYRMALRENPNAFKAYVNMGKALVTAGRLNSAIECLQKAVRIHPRSAEAHINLGNAMALDGNWVGAKNHLTQALNLNPESAEAHYNLGELLSRQGKLQAAQDHLRRAVKLRHGWVQAINSLALVMARLGKFKEAVHHFEESLRRNPDNFSAHHNLGIVYERQGKFDQALVHLRQALQGNADDAMVYNSIGIVLARQGHYQEAQNQFQQALRINPQLTQARRNLEIAQQRQKTLQ